MHTLADLRAGKLSGIKRLDLSCGLTEFPPEIFDLADSLQVLNLSGNALDSLPHDLHRLHRLEVLFGSDNRFTELPACIGQCQGLRIVGFKANRIRHVPAQALPPALRWLILTDNCIESLPEELGRQTELQKLMLAGNQLTRLPDLSACHKLELLRVAANRLTSLPHWLLKLPALAWLAHGDNPLSTPPAERAIRDIPWSALQLEQRLGEGASGVIQQARWNAGEKLLPVAVKLYKGDVTSDGSPLNEMAACIAAGDHPQLIGVLGRVDRHPQATRGLVMDLIAPTFINLAGPPSLESCTRDVYRPDMRIRLPVVLRMASGIASVTAHLHNRNITHGDLYGHNILWEPDGRCLLGDFGAASFLPGADAQSQTSLALQRIETRAYGILLGELLDRCEPLTGETGILDQLRQLQRDCTQADVESRPSMPAVASRLRALGA